MGGKYINHKTAELYMKYRLSNELTQEAAAAKVGISVRSARTIEHKQHYTAKAKKPRTYKTRTSPLSAIWESELKSMLSENPNLQPKTLLIYLQRNYLDAQGMPIFTAKVERTLQRYVAKWLALNGKPKEIMFPQVHIPGEQALSDFTHFDYAEVTINGMPFKHMFYHFRLVYSRWSYLKLILTGESMQALSEGLQEALLCLGGATNEHRTDSLSAAFKNLSADAQRDLTDQYEELCAHYNMIPTRNNKGEKHENGSVESSHGHIKNRIAQELVLRGSHDFSSIADYEQWIHNIVKASNERNSIDFETEKKALQPLPNYKVTDYEVKSVKVSNLSVVIIKGIRYSVPSSLSGHLITLHIYQTQIKVYLGSTFMFDLERIYFQKNASIYHINYKHVIHSLIKKPAAFRRCQYRDELLPNQHYHFIWHYLERTESLKVAPKIMLRFLRLAADYDCEVELGLYVVNLIKSKQAILIEEIESQFNTSNPKMPMVECRQHNIAEYDFIINTTTTNTGEDYATI